MQLILAPPPQYDHPFHGQVIERRLSPLEFLKLCHGFVEGCALVSKDVCYIALPQNEKDQRLIAAIRRHELAHCNGWPADHPGGHWVDLDPPPGVTVYRSGRTQLKLF